MKHKYKMGAVITIIKSSYSGINPGDKGEITQYIKEGYGIQFTKIFPNVDCNTHPKLETRTVYFEEHEIKL